MTYSTDTTYDFSPFDRGYFSRNAFPHTVSGAVALALSMLVGGWILYIHSTAVLYAPPDATLSFDEASAVAPRAKTARVVYEVPETAPAVTAAPSVDEAPETAPAVRAPSGVVEAPETAPTVAAPSGVVEAPAGTPGAILDSNEYIALLDFTIPWVLRRVHLRRALRSGRTSI